MLFGGLVGLWFFNAWIHKASCIPLRCMVRRWADLHDGGIYIFNGWRHEAQSVNTYGIISSICLNVILGFIYDVHICRKKGKGAFVFYHPPCKRTYLDLFTVCYFSPPSLQNPKVVNLSPHAAFMAVSG